jgi:hypothetical protein
MGRRETGRLDEMILYVLEMLAFAASVPTLLFSAT